MNQEKLDYCNGFLEAMQLLNSEVSDVYANFELELLPPSTDLESALNRYFEEYGRHRISPAREFPAERWNISTTRSAEPPEQTLHDVCSKWFFISSRMSVVPKNYHYRHNVLVTFIDALKSALSSFSVQTVHIHPPFWYAMEWDNLVLETDEARYILHLSHSN